MGDAVAGPGVQDAVARRERLQVAVLVHVLIVDLQDVVVDVHDRERHGDAVRPERLELEGGHGTGGVLYQDLVHRQVHLLFGREFSCDQVPGEYLAGEVLRFGHGPFLPCAGTK